jgi:hypothetical protein
MAKRQTGDEKDRKAREEQEAKNADPFADIPGGTDNPDEGQGVAEASAHRTEIETRGDLSPTGPPIGLEGFIETADQMIARSGKGNTAAKPTHYLISHARVGNFSKGATVSAKSISADEDDLSRLVSLGAIVPVDKPKDA